MSTVSLRYFNIFGPRQNPASPYAAVISKFAQMLCERKQPTIFGDGTQTRDFTYVDNVVAANLLAASSPRAFAGEIFNIGTGVRISLLEVLDAMGRSLGVDCKPAHGPGRAGDIEHSVADISKARELLGYEPMVDFATGLDRMLKS